MTPPHNLPIGVGQDGGDAARRWITAAWLLSVEARALVEDMEGGVAQPEMQQLARLRWLSVVFDVERLLLGRRPASREHVLAIMFEDGFSQLASVEPARLIADLSLADGIGEGGFHIDPVLQLWDGILRDFPGELPDPLTNEGQSAVLRALRRWSKACDAVGVELSFLTSLMKEA